MRNPAQRGGRPKKLRNRPTRRFLYKLCHHLGKTEDELLNGPHKLTTGQLVGWMTEYQLRPFEFDDDLRFAHLSTMVAKSFLQTDAVELFKLFMPKRTNYDPEEEPAVEQTAESTAGMLECAGFTVVRGVRPQ